LNPHHTDHVGLRADERYLRDLAHLGEVGVLAQKSIAWMNGVDIGNLGGADDRRDVEITARALRRTDTDSLVGKTRVQAVAVGFGIYRDGANPEFLASAYHPQGDLAAIGDEDLPKRCGWQRGPPRIPPAARSSRVCFQSRRRLRTLFRS